MALSLPDLIAIYILTYPLKYVSGETISLVYAMLYRSDSSKYCQNIMISLPV